MEAKRMFFTQVDFLNSVVTVCAGIIVFVVVLKLIRRFQSWSDTSTESPGEKTDFGACRFPDCIRCRRHKTVLMNARTRLTYWEDDKHSPSSASSQLADDIQASYQKLNSNTSQDKEKLGNNIHNPLIFRMKGIRAQPVWNLEEFPGIASLTDHTEEIHKELTQLMEDLDQNAGDSPGFWKVNDTPSGKWSICHLVDQGLMTKAVSQCPLTWRAVSSLPTIMKGNVFGNVAFSIVEPGTKISPHCGPTNIRIRCHLGLRTPQGCKLKVADSSLEWTEGGLLCFDESYPHHVDFSAAEAGSQSRLVLIVDLWHPDITADQRNLVDYAFSPEN